jgi:hypothetical protein
VTAFTSSLQIQALTTAYSRIMPDGAVLQPCPFQDSLKVVDDAIEMKGWLALKRNKRC